MSEYVLELKGITKIFPGVKALNNVQFQLKPGEIHALMGENGAGKSTFIKVITGVHKAEEGEMYLDGNKLTFKINISNSGSSYEFLKLDKKIIARNGSQVREEYF